MKLKKTHYMKKQRKKQNCETAKRKSQTPEKVCMK